MRTKYTQAMPAKRKRIISILLTALAGIVLFALIWGLTGSKTYTTTFKLLDIYGQPIYDTNVRCCSRTPFERIFVPENETSSFISTDSGGSFTLDNCKRGIWTFDLTIGSDSYTIQRYLMGSEKRSRYAAAFGS